MIGVPAGDGDMRDFFIPKLLRRNFRLSLFRIKGKIVAENRRIIPWKEARGRCMRTPGGRIRTSQQKLALEVD